MIKINKKKYYKQLKSINENIRYYEKALNNAMENVDFCGNNLEIQSLCERLEIEQTNKQLFIKKGGVL